MGIGEGLRDSRGEAVSARTHADREILYGVHPVAECIRAGRRKVRRIRISEPRRLKALEELTGKRLSDLVEHADRRSLDREAGSGHHQGVLAWVGPYPYVDWRDLITGSGRLLLLLDNLTDPQNVGAILRTAHCAGVTGVTLRSHHAATITPAVAKASAGAVEHLSIGLVSNQSMVLRACGEEGFTRLALDMAGEPLWEAPVPWKENLACVVGAEDKGVSRLVGGHCDLRVAIPMKGTLDSLNASVAAALVLFEAARHRHNLSKGSSA